MLNLDNTKILLAVKHGSYFVGDRDWREGGRFA